LTKVSEVMDCINTIESIYDVAAWRVNGLRIWPITRIHLSILIRDHDFVGPKIEPRTRRGFISLLKGFSISFFSILELILTPGFWRGFSAVVLTKPSGTHRGFNIYSGPLQEQMRNHGTRHLVIEVSNRPRRPRRGEAVLLFDRYWLAMIIRMLYSILRLFRRASMDLPGHRSAGNLVSARFPAVGRHAFSKPSLIREAVFIEAYRLFFRLLLDLLRPNKALIICYYTNLAMGFILAARQRHALSADYQHGVQGKLHYAYGSWKNFPPTGYELLPDVFLNWSELEKLSIDQWAAPTPHQSIVVGNLLSEHVRNRFASYAQKYGDSLRSLGTRPLVLYSLQNFVPPDWIWDAIRDTSAELKWLIRLHPLHSNLLKVVRENLETRKVKDYDMDQASRLPLPFLLPNIAVHVTGNSSVVLEALYAGKPSIVIDHYGLEYYADLIAAGNVSAAFDPRQLAQALHSAVSRAPAPYTAGQTSSFLQFLDSNVRPGIGMWR
jgi:hypothetical protein